MTPTKTDPTTTSIIQMYLTIFVRYIIFSTSFFDWQFMGSTGLVIILLWMNSMKERLSKEVLDIGKFFAHLLFISVCFSLICAIISTVYNIIFYFGFVNTIIITNIGLMTMASGIVTRFKAEIDTYIARSVIGSKLLSVLNYYYNTYIVSKKVYDKIWTGIKYGWTHYLWANIKTICLKLYNINSDLATNTQSQIVGTKMISYYNSGKSYLIDQFVQSYFKSFNNAMTADPFTLGAVDISKKQYKNKITDTNINNSMSASKTVETIKKNSFLESATIANPEQMDDLDDDLEPENETSQKIDRSATTEPKSESITESVPATPVQTPEERRAELKRKIREMRNARKGKINANVPISNKNKKALKKTAANMMKMPGMEQMMETMLKGDNLKKLMNQIPAEQLQAMARKN